MSDEKLPPGWVRLEVAEGVGGFGTIYIHLSSIVSVYTERGVVEEIVIRDGNPVTPNHTPAEVLSRIAEAQLAQRKFDAAPGMAATLTAACGTNGDEWCLRPRDAAYDAAGTIDAIEARERGE